MISPPVSSFTMTCAVLSVARPSEMEMAGLVECKQMAWWVKLHTR
ncbi:hypothetical protein PSYPI_10650 [Pseudomonas syringae pv. pisi str. 1704B]|uniref:Uncharacterized protein n=1 Tax=Pseudomonas syringae pv. pisi str. 1704B TaxID=629263 RepID=F3G6Y2_PSESJ|nr:hypothetical protein PSYPI_10650 [Pseudomonas syringae pv. pisi str. 1704B]